MNNLPQFLVNTNYKPGFLVGRLYFPTPSTPVPPTFLSSPIRVLDDKKYGSSGKRVIWFVSPDPELYRTLAVYCPHPRYKFRTIHLIQHYLEHTPF